MQTCDIIHSDLSTLDARKLKLHFRRYKLALFNLYTLFYVVVKYNSEFKIKAATTTQNLHT